MSRPEGIEIVSLSLLLGCTPLGGWLYDDPTFVLSEVARGAPGARSDILDIVLTACNRNEFDLQGSDLEISLEVEGRAAGTAQWKEGYVLPMRDTTRLLVELAMPATGWEGVRYRTAEGMRYVLLGRTTIATPLGVRQVPFTQRGEMRLDAKGRSAPLGPQGPVCRPGKSTVPPFPATLRIAPPARPETSRHRTGLR